MRAKLRVTSVKPLDGAEELEFMAVGPKGSYPEGGADEDNSYALYTPSAHLRMTVNNPALLGKFKQGQTFYVDFTEVSEQA